MQDTDLKITSKDSNTHRFQYDHCFWSFDDVQAPFADQRRVYYEIARPLLDKAFEGYNTCLFAYGQVGGKDFFVTILLLSLSLYCRLDQGKVTGKNYQRQINIVCHYYVFLSPSLSLSLSQYNG